MSSNATHDVVTALKAVLKQLTNVIEEKSITQPVRLLAVSKTKPADAVMKAYEAGQRHFGENYVNEIALKASQCPSDIKWHFIGHLQSNKALKLAQIPNLYQVECIDSVKIANKLNNACITAGRKEPLRVLVQVNTSGEASKSGCEPSDCVGLATHVHTNCHALKLAGLMTIGQYEALPTEKFFKVLNKCKDDVIKAIPSLNASDFEMSMGMSHDFDVAVANGSTQIRVGTAIFGSRGPTIDLPDEPDATHPSTTSEAKHETSTSSTLSSDPSSSHVAPSVTSSPLSVNSSGDTASDSTKQGSDSSSGHTKPSHTQ